MDGSPQADLAALVADYVKVRDLKSEIDEAHKERVAEYNKALLAIEAKVLQFLQDHNLETVKTEAGTAYVRTVKSASIADGEAFRKFVIETGKYELTDWKANANAVQDYVTTEGNLPPGVNYSSMQKIGVRRS